jgi:phenylalanyl-tRNA synthetase beta chain
MANSLTTAAYAKLSTVLKEEHNVTMLNPRRPTCSPQVVSPPFSAWHSWYSLPVT